jgi:hypothetical protein|tara:strand:- start:184 stop:567 length:384 start_codon:yes stop_codon:yes gene_type:complete
MYLKTIFKRLVLTDLALSILIIVSVFYESEQVAIFNEKYSIMSDSMSIFYLIILVVWLVNLYFLYNFKKIGKQIFVSLFIITIIIILPSGSMAVDAKDYILDGLGWSLNGAMLVFLYFTPIKKEFEK